MLCETSSGVLCVLNLFLVEDGDAREIIDSIIDWIDSGDGDGEEEYGAENSHYMRLNPPYPCKNGPIESIEELLLIQGFTAELLYGTEDKPGLASLLTPWGDDGKINLNTAAQPLLQAMAEGFSKETSESMIEYREDEAHKDLLNNPIWYKAVPSYPGNIVITKELITVQSLFFTINAEATIDTLQKNSHCHHCARREGHCNCTMAYRIKFAKNSIKE